MWMSLMLIRQDFAKDRRNHAYYKYSASSIDFVADTSYKTMSVTLNMKFNQQLVPFNDNSDSLVVRPYLYTKINKVYFHLSDTIHVRWSIFQIIANVRILKILTIDSIF